jgi:alkylated DNA repair dioxygenase AlkB
MRATLTRTPLVWQGSLFGTGTPTPDAGFHGVVRTQLDDTSWVDVVPGWLSGADELFTSLLHRLAWQSNEMPMYGQLVRQPRLSAWWRLDDERVRQPLLATLAEAAGRHYGVTFESIGANLYRDGRDSVAWHADRHARAPQDPDVVIPVLSLGGPRRFLLRPRRGGPSIAFQPAGGDLIVMGGACQRDWHHSVPKMALAQPRMSITFRYATP